MLHGERVPTPDPNCTDPDADLEEPIFLLLSASTRVAVRDRSPIEDLS